jgi:hypothetical protein
MVTVPRAILEPSYFADDKLSHWLFPPILDLGRTLKVREGVYFIEIQFRNDMIMNVQLFCMILSLFQSSYSHLRISASCRIVALHSQIISTGCCQ